MQARKKKRKPRESEVCRRSTSHYGPIQEKNVQINPLPPVGSFVVIMNEFTYRDMRSYKEMPHTFYVPSNAPSHRDAYGNALVFEVEGYSYGIEDALNPANRVRLRHYYGGDRSRGSMVEEIRALDVAIGIMRLDIVKDATLSSIIPEIPEELRDIVRRGGESDA